ncbi:MAG: hypothetical protein LC790_01535 [Actinobacteria bacterium]|nr:hypothetical protein [Actinomycetota bacterium]MCA1697639.1 hypothetical protein [Actinomycetota bacterium]
MTSEHPTAALTLKRQRAGAARLVAALEHAWQQIRARHPDVPRVQIVIGQGSGHRGGLLLGQLAPERWQPSGPGELVHELLVGGEGLARGAVDVFTTLLHEAAHALALTRQIADTSRDGRYHNQRYRQLAHELGLEVQRDAQQGFSSTRLTPLTQARYQPAISAIADAITLHRRPEPAANTRRNLAVAVCACPRRIRVAPGTLRAGPITCEICQQPFSTPPAATANWGVAR